MNFLETMTDKPEDNEFTKRVHTFTYFYRDYFKKCQFTVCKFSVLAVFYPPQGGLVDMLKGSNLWTCDLSEDPFNLAFQKLSTLHKRIIKIEKSELIC